MIISGKLEKDEKLLIVKEGRVGDEILFSSMYNNLIENDFSGVKIECDIRLLEIFKRSFNKNIFRLDISHLQKLKVMNLIKLFILEV